MLMYVDWRKVRDEPLLPEIRKVLCSGDPDLLRKFYVAGFKRYFTSEEPKTPDLGETLRRFSCAQYSTLDDIINTFFSEFPVPYFSFDVIGQLHPDSHKKVRNDMPEMCDTETDKLILGGRFYKSLVRPGTGFVHSSGIPCIVILNKEFSDSEINPRIRYVFLAIPRVVFPLEPECNFVFEYEGELVKTPD